MAFVLKDRVRETSTSTGTGNVVLAGAIADHRAFGDVLSNADTTWYAIVHPGTGAWETGLGTYNSGTNALARTTVFESSNSNSLVSFAAGIKEVTIDLPASRIAQGGALKLMQLDSSGKVPVLDGSQLTYSDRTNVAGAAFVASTKGLFVQTSAPTGWTKDTTHNDKGLRIVSGTASTGGSSPFSTVFAKTATDSYTLTSTDMPVHAHTGTTGNDTPDHDHTILLGAQIAQTQFGASGHTALEAGGTGNNQSPGANQRHAHPFTTDNTGSGGSHLHGIDLRVQYVDTIIATKS
jgi:hypothetical protein